MKRIVIAAVAAVFALAACSTAATAPSPTAATITPIPSVKTTTPATAAAATQAPAASQAASAPAASAPAANAAPRKVEITATNSDYSIKTLTVKAGEKIEFVVKNVGEEKHNLVGIGEGISLVSPDFDFGSTVSWIWTAPTKTGTFKMQCSYHTTIPPIQITVN